jgi:hypothetical protein
MLRAAGIEGLRVISNRLRLDGSAGRFEFDAGHPQCTACGTCKMLAVTSARERGPLAYVGDGHSDRYGALYSDLVFAKGILAGLCLADGIDLVPWTSFDDVRSFLEDGAPRRPVNPDQCPGWRVVEVAKPSPRLTTDPQGRLSARPAGAGVLHPWHTTIPRRAKETER